MKVLVVLAVVAFVNCDKFSADEISVAQAELIKKTIAELTEMASHTLTALPKIVGVINDHIAHMDQMMMAEADRQANAGFPLMKTIFQKIHDKVYLIGKNTALAELPVYMAKNSTDGKTALAKFAGTAVVIDWRCTLDQERRTVHPTQCKDEQGGWADWKVETDKVVSVLQKLIPELEANKAAFWAHQHQRMLDCIQSGLPDINDAIKAEPSQEKRAKYLCLLTENLNLLNTVASSR